MAKTTVSPQAIKVSLTWFEAIRALRSSFTIPMANIRGATEDSKYVSSGELGFRNPGTGFPGLIAEGTFYHKGQKVLSLWRKGQQIVVIELTGAKWDRIVLGCQDSKDLAKKINLEIAK